MDLDTERRIVLTLLMGGLAGVLAYSLSVVDHADTDAAEVPMTLIEAIDLAEAETGARGVAASTVTDGAESVHAVVVEASGVATRVLVHPDSRSVLRRLQVEARPEARGAAISLVDAALAAEHYTRGRAVEVEPEDDDVIEVEIVINGTEVEVDVDARTGRVLRQRADD